MLLISMSITDECIVTKNATKDFVSKYTVFLYFVVIAERLYIKSIFIAIFLIFLVNVVLRHDKEASQ